MGRVKQDFIPNDVALGGELPNLVLLTGANMVHLTPGFQSDRAGGQVDSVETNVYRRNHGASRMLCPRSKRANDPCRSHHVSIGCK
jgi:hypothetical protein